MKTPALPKKEVAKKARVTPKSPGQRASMSSVENTHEKNNVTLNLLLKEQEIASRACKIWQEQGCPQGFEEMHRRLAQQEILGVSSGGCAA
jgi:hypothetical protein